MGELREEVQAVPDLAPLLDSDADADAARHHTLFGLDVFPYASHFLDPRGQLGGPVADATRRWLLDAGCGPRPERESLAPEPPSLTRSLEVDHLEPDHLSSMLWCLASAAEARPWDRGWGDSLPEGDILWWLPVFRTAVKRAVRRGPGDAGGVPPEPSHTDFWAEVVDLVWELVLDHRTGPDDSSPVRALPTARGPWPPPADEPPTATGSEAFGPAARFLTTPARAGFHLGRCELTALARRLDLPAGFGGRAVLLENLLGAAVRYDRESSLVEGLMEIVEAYRGAYRKLDEIPLLTRPRDHWLQRARVAADFIPTLF